MARAVAAPARAAPAANWTLLGWGAVTFVSGLLLPWSREQRELLTFSYETIGAAVLWARPEVAVALVAALAALLIGVAPLPQFRRGYGAAAAGLAGAVVATAGVLARGEPLGMGAAAVIMGHLSLAGTGLALGGLLQVDPFLGAAILWVAAFIAAFILFPLIAVLQAAVIVQGRFTLAVAWETIRSPAFLVLDRPATPYNEVTRAAVAGLAGAVAAGFMGLVRTRRPAVALQWSLAGGGAVFALTWLASGFGAVRNSVLLAVAVGTISTLLGFLFALLAERSRLPTRRLLGPFSLLPIITPPFVLGLAMIYMFGRRGFITHTVLGLSTSAFFGPVGVAFAQILAFTPIAFLVLQGVVRALDMALEEAAETLGASRWHVLRTVIWPLARPGVANAFLLVAIESLADFGNPIIVGGGVPYLATEVFFAIIGRFNPHEAAVYGMALLAMTLSIFLIQRYWIGSRGYVTVTGKPGGGSVRPMPPALDYAVTGVFVLYALVALLLYGSVFTGAFTKLWGFNYAFTWDHIRSLSPQGWHVFWTSTRLAALAAIPSTILGFLIAYLVSRTRFPGRSALEFSSMLSFAVPGTVMGIGYILAFNRGALLLTGTELIILLAFIFRNMPVGIRAGIAAIHQLDRSIEEASTMLGAGAASTLRRVVVPLIRPALLSGLVFGFVRAMTAISQVIFLISPQHNLATTQILSYVEYGSLGRGAALAAVLIVLMAGVILMLYLVTKRLDPRALREIVA